MASLQVAFYDIYGMAFDVTLFSRTEGNGVSDPKNCSSGIGQLQLAAHPGECLLLDCRFLPKAEEPVDLRVAAEPR